MNEEEKAAFQEWRDTFWKWGSSTDEPRALRAWQKAQEKKDAEIERLTRRFDDMSQKETYKEWLHNQSRIAVLEDQIQKLTLQREGDKKLITELADAIEHESWVSEQQCGLPSQFVELIPRAREAAK